MGILEHLKECIKQNNFKLNIFCEIIHLKVPITCQKT